MKTSLIQPNTRLPQRIVWLDHLRTFLIFLVVLCHAGGVYESSGAWASFWINELNTNSYYVYIIHVIVLGSIAMMLLNTTMPSILKYLVLTVSTFGLSHLICYSGRKAYHFMFTLGQTNE